MIDKTKEKEYERRLKDKVSIRSEHESHESKLHERHEHHHKGLKEHYRGLSLRGRA